MSAKSRRLRCRLDMEHRRGIFLSNETLRLRAVLDDCTRRCVSRGNTITHLQRELDAERKAHAETKERWELEGRNH